MTKAPQQKNKFDISSLSKELSPQAAPLTWECALNQAPMGGKALVAAAGRGGLSWLLKKNGFDVTSMDLHPEHFVAPGMECIKADFNNPIGLDDAQFDFILAVEVVEHLENPWLFLREAIRLLKQGGLLVFTSPNVVSIPARMLFLRSGLLPYFREESFVGCYHVTPIFPWAVMRWASTTNATLTSITYSRANWPTKRDIPRHWEPKLIASIKKYLPVNSLTGEISCYTVKRLGEPSINIGVHSA